MHSFPKKQKKHRRQNSSISTDISAMLTKPELSQTDWALSDIFLFLMFLGKSGGKHRSMRYKWVCHKSVQTGNTRRCTCETPCTNSSYGKCTYTYPDKNFRNTPGIPRNTEHWKNLYRHRTLAERTINLFKNAFGLDNLKTLHPKTIRFDLFLAGCIQLIGVILAKAIHKEKLYKSIRKIVALAA